MGVASILCLLAAAFELIIAVYLTRCAGTPTDIRKLVRINNLNKGVRASRLMSAVFVFCFFLHLCVTAFLPSKRFYK